MMMKCSNCDDTGWLTSAVEADFFVYCQCVAGLNKERDHLIEQSAAIDKRLAEIAEKLAT
jgi:hypothetical protein